MDAWLLEVASPLLVPSSHRGRLASHRLLSSIPVRVKPAAKEDMLRRALRAKEAHHGGDHYQVAITLSNLAIAHGIFVKPVARKGTSRINWDATP